LAQLAAQTNRLGLPGNRWHTADHPISPKVIWSACKEAAQRAGIRKEVHPHTLDVEETDCAEMLDNGVGLELPFAEQIGVVLADVIRPRVGPENGGSSVRTRQRLGDTRASCWQRNCDARVPQASTFADGSQRPPCDRTIPRFIRRHPTEINADECARVSVCRFGFVQVGIAAGTEDTSADQLCDARFSGSNHPEHCLPV
jgi:hypothetical protein